MSVGSKRNPKKNYVEIQMTKHSEYQENQSGRKVDVLVTSRRKLLNVESQSSDIDGDQSNRGKSWSGHQIRQNKRIVEVGRILTTRSPTIVIKLGTKLKVSSNDQSISSN